MRRLRGVLSRIAVTWLLCHSATLMLAPAVLWSGSGKQLLECTCTHGDHAVCPMHHKPAPGSKICLMSSATDESGAVLTSLFGGAGPVPAQAAVARPDARLAIEVATTTTRSLRLPPPDPPPPRA